MVVITGASSGIGRAAATTFAERGASVVLAARSGDALRDAVRECDPSGARSLAVPTDVTDERAVEELAQRAVERFGRIDVWVNNAGVIAYGQFQDTPSEVYRRVVEINLFGQLNGARAALERFEAQESGVLVNLASVWGRVTSPYVGPYVVSKFGVRSFSESLRQGLRDRSGAEDVHVSTILPESIDTPIFSHGANYSGRPVRPVPPIADPDRVVRAIVRCAERPRPEVTVGLVGHLVEWGDALMPTRLYNRLMPILFRRTAFGPGAAGPTPGNLFEPAPETGRVDGGWRQTKGARVRRRVAAAGLVAAPLAAAEGLRRRRTGR